MPDSPATASVPVQGSLKRRLTLFTLAVFLAGLWSLAFYASRMLREDLTRLLGEQQLSTVKLMAKSIDDALRHHVALLDALALELSSGQRPLDALPGCTRSTLALMFGAGLYATDQDGRVLAASAPCAGDPGEDRHGEPAVAAILGGAESWIGDPHVDARTGGTVFELAVPLRDRGGGRAGVLVGRVVLAEAGFLHVLSANRYGRSGGYQLIARAQRQLILSTWPTATLAALPAPAQAPYLDDFLAGHAGTAIGTAPGGEEWMLSARPLETVGWLLVAQVPTTEAFAPIRALQWRTLAAALLLTVLAGSATYWKLRRELRPLRLSTNHLAELAAQDDPQETVPVPPRSAREIAVLIASFNRLLLRLHARAQALSASEAKFHLLFDNTSDAVVLLGEHGFEDCNAAALRLFGCVRSADFRAIAPEQLFSTRQPDGEDPLARYHALASRALDSGHVAFEWHYRRLDDGSVFVCETSFDAMSLDGRRLLQMTCHDVTERRRMEEQIRSLAFFDVLTGLPNRRLLGDRLGQAIAAGKRSQRYAALMFLDLDNFKALNDREGHDAGDLLLIEAAQRLRREMREADTVARFGGDEFVVLIGELSSDSGQAHQQAADIAEKLRARLSAPYVFESRHEGQPPHTIVHHCTASIGVVVFRGDGVAREDVLRIADAAMYRAKDGGRNRVCFGESVVAAAVAGQAPG